MAGSAATRPAHRRITLLYCTAELEPVESAAQFAHENLGDLLSAGRIWVDEIGGDQTRLCGVPAGHGSFAAHGIERVEEGAARVLRHTPLHRHDARHGGHRFDLSGTRLVA